MTRLWAILAAIGAALASIAIYGSVKKREGIMDALMKAKEADYDKASNIRDNVSDTQRVHDDDIRFRD